MKKLVIDVVTGEQREVELAEQEAQEIQAEWDSERLRLAEIREAARLKALEPTPEQRIAELEAKLAKLMAALGE